MTDRELLQQALDALENAHANEPIWKTPIKEAIEALRARLAQPEQELNPWRFAAQRLGEDLSTVGPDGYYNMSASEWLDWAMEHITPARIEQEPWVKTYSGGKPNYTQPIERKPILPGGGIGRHPDIPIKVQDEREENYKSFAQSAQVLGITEPEPVAWKDKYGAVIPHSHKLFKPELFVDYTIPLYTVPLQQPEQEPVAWITGGGKGELWWHQSEKFDTEGNLIGKNQEDIPLYTAPPKKEWVGLTEEETMASLPSALRAPPLKMPPGWRQFADALETILKEKNYG